MPSRRPAGPCCYSPVGCYRSGVSLRETGQPVAPGELTREQSSKPGELAREQSSQQRRSLRFRKSSELKVETSETSELARADQHQQIRFSSSSFGDSKRIQLCQRAKEVKRVGELSKLEVYERIMEEEEQLYATVRRVKGEGEGFRPYQAPRQPWGYQVTENSFSSPSLYGPVHILLKRHGV